MTESVFHHMSRLVLARDLQSPLGPPLQHDQPAEEAFELLCESSFLDGYDAMDRFSLVIRDGEPVGWTSLDTLDNGATVADSMAAINPGSVLSSDTTALQVADLFETTRIHSFFVLEHNEITGILAYEDLFGLPFRLCLLALTLGLEQSALNLLSHSPTESWQALPQRRQEKAREVHRSRYGEKPRSEGPPLQQWLGCTMFCDKATMLKKRQLLAEWPGRRIDAVFSEAENVRNVCAHTDRDEGFNNALIARRELPRFLRDVQSLTSAIDGAGESLG